MTIVQLIRMARHQKAVRDAGDYKTWINTVLDARWVGARANWGISGEAVEAQINHSSWVASCPDCNERVIVDIDEPFYCPNCQNIKNDGLARPVQFPDQWKLIERILLLRPDPDTRNWIGENVETLQDENRNHGLSEV